MRKIPVFIAILLLLSACGMEADPHPSTDEPAPSTRANLTLTVVPSTPTPTSMPTPTNIHETSEPCFPEGQLDDNFLVIGYLPEYRRLNPDWGKCLTDLVYFSIQPLPDGNLDTSTLSVDTLQTLREMQGTYHIRIHISIGGWQRSDNFAPMATKPKSRKLFVRNLLSFCLENGLDGADFDWEFPQNEQERRAYADLLAEAIDAFHLHDLLISVALAPSDPIDLAPYASADRIHIMSYDRGVRHATLDQAGQDIGYFLSAGATPKKLILGLPFYGRTKMPPYTGYSYAEIVERYHPAPIFDEVDNIYFNGIGTIQQKTCLAKTMGLGGVMVWELGQDSMDGSSLLAAIYKAASRTNCEE